MDLVEQNASFLEQARASIEPSRIHRAYCQGLQEFNPEGDTYDLVWIQWVVNYLTDDDLVSFLKRCRASLRPGGLVCLKENITMDGFMVDREDSSITRSDGLMKAVFERAELTLLAEQVQSDFPKEIYEVKMYALR